MYKRQDNERAFVDDGLAGEARLIGGESTALEYIDGRIDRILLEVGFRLPDICLLYTSEEGLPTQNKAAGKTCGLAVRNNRYEL